MPTINATPFPYEFDIDHIALVCIDMQRDFCLPGGFAESLGNNLANIAPCAPVIGRLQAAFRKAGLPVIFDIDYRPYSWPSPAVASEVLTRAGEESDMIVGNDEEFGFMAGGIEKGLDKARELAASGKLVIYKMGHEGALTIADGEEIRTGIYPVTAVKPNGAGDSFMAGLLAAIAEGRPLKEAVLRGSACASIVVSQPGCAPAMPTTAELDAFLAERPGPTDV